MGYNHKAIDLLLRSIDARDRTAHRSVVDFLVADNKHLRAELAAAIKQRDEAHGLIREWLRCNAVEVVEGPLRMYALTPMTRCYMDDAHKRAFLAATRKEGGGA